MSGLLGNKGPGILGKMMAYGDKRSQSKEAPGFSGTKVQNSKGEWVSIDRGRRSRRRRYRGAALAHSAFTGIF